MFPVVVLVLGQDGGKTTRRVRSARVIIFGTADAVRLLIFMVTS